VTCSARQRDYFVEGDLYDDCSTGRVFGRWCIFHFGGDWSGIIKIEGITFGDDGVSCVIFGEDSEVSVAVAVIVADWGIAVER
jgi:hypothetical protein